MKILIIDDDIGSTVTLKALLISQDNLEIDIANSGRDGLKMLDEGGYGAIILDVMMPDFSGLDLCRELNKNDEYKNLPIILASALPINSKELEDMLTEFRSLCNIIGVLEKPFVMEELLKEINKIRIS